MLMKRLYLFLYCALLSIITYGQSGRLFTADQDLSSSLINYIYQDRNGMIWIATEDGLNRYDGSSFTIYRHNSSDEHSLVHNYVRSLFEDNQGRLYIGTYSGLQLYNPDTDNFSAPARMEDGSICNYMFVSFLQRQNGEIWASGSSLCTLTVENDIITVHSPNLDMPVDRTDYILEDVSGNLWATRGLEGVCRISPNNSVQYYLKQERGMIVDICEDRYGDIYVASLRSGLYKYNNPSNSFNLIASQEKRPLPVKDIFCNSQDQLYLGTDGMGMKIFNISSNTITDYILDDLHFNSKTAKVHSIIRDREGNLWAAIYQKGVLMIPAQPNNFKYIGYQSSNKNFIGSNCITSFCKDHNGILWIGTDNDGIYSLTPDFNGKSHFGAGVPPNGIPPTIMSLYEDSHHQIWVGSYLQGMGQLNPLTGQLTPIRDLLDNDGNPVTRVYDFQEDHNERLWIGTMGSGLYYYDLTQRQIRRDSVVSEGVDPWITCLHFSQNHYLYIGTFHGLFCIDLDNPQQEHKAILTQSIIHCLYESEQGSIWVGSSEGLTNWTPNVNSIITYTTANGLPASAVYAIQGDGRDCLWLSSNNGLAQFNTLTLKCINYYVNDGLQGNEFSKNSSFKDAQGLLWFGGVNGITYFNPIEITNPSRKWDVRITNFYLHNEAVHTGTKSGRYPVIDSPVFEATRFNLSYKDNTFSIEFATEQLLNSERITYQYALNDYKWINTQRGTNIVSFSNLPPGSYHFRLRALDNTILSEVKEIVLQIHPGWWETILAKICYFLIGFFAIAFIIRQIRNHYHTKQEILQHAHKEQINEAKFQLFTNISHEIRSPMSLIISPLKKLMESDADPDRQRTYRTISRNAQRILMLVNQLMDIRKLDQGHIKLHFQQTDVVGFITDMCDTYTPEAIRRDIQLSFSHPQIDHLLIWIDPANFDKIILNLLSNAFKFTPNKGKITLYLSTGTDADAPLPLQEYAEIIVADNGIGIPDNEKEHIFERFYQIHNSTNNSNVGTGIGLHLVHSLVELQYGDIRVSNHLDGSAGSRFIIRLPLGNAHLSNEDIDTHTVNASLTGLGSVQSLPGITPISPDSSAENVPKVRVRTKYRVLIAEDDAEIRDYLCQEFSGLYHMNACEDGEEALKLVFSWKPDLVISDVMMPKMDGLELCGKIKQNVTLNHLPVVLLTAKTLERDTIEGLENGADAYITKPFNIEVLSKTVSNLLVGREKLRNTFGGKQLQEEKLDKIETKSSDDLLMERVLRIINQNLSNPQLTVESVADQVGISRVHLHRKLKELTNQTSRDFIRNVRLKQAAVLLSQKRQSIAQVADEVGFANPNTFSTAFKELFGVPPTTYMEDHLPK